MKKGDIGRLGELETARYLRKHGYEVVSASFRSRYGEIDLIAHNGKYICFVEVKARSEGQLFRPADSVTASKRSKIISTANIYLSQNETKLQPRFDISEVFVSDSGQVIKINYLENAYSSDGR